MSCHARLNRKSNNSLESWAVKFEGCVKLLHQPKSTVGRSFIIVVVILSYHSRNMLLLLLFTNIITLFIDISTVKRVFFFSWGRVNHISTQRGFPQIMCWAWSRATPLWPWLSRCLQCCRNKRRRKRLSVGSTYPEKAQISLLSSYLTSDALP